MLALATAWVVSPVALIAVLGPWYESRYSEMAKAAELPAATQWALHVYPYTFLFALGVIPLYLLSRLDRAEKRLRTGLVSLVILLIVAETIWSLSVWYPLWLLAHKFASVV